MTAFAIVSSFELMTFSDEREIVDKEDDDEDRSHDAHLPDSVDAELQEAGL